MQAVPSQTGGRLHPARDQGQHPGASAGNALLVVGGPAGRLQACADRTAGNGSALISDRTALPGTSSLQAVPMSVHMEPWGYLGDGQGIRGDLGRPHDG